MSNLNTNASRYYLFSLANFLAAFGGGMILGKGVGVIDNVALHGSSVLAFLMGSVFGLGLLQYLEVSSKVRSGFSVGGALASMVLLAIFIGHADDGKVSDIYGWLFFIFLCIRFGFWFYSRVLRASAASRGQQKIAWVEFGYYSGIVLGLLIWSLCQIEIDMSTALMLDIFLQLVAGLIDIINAETQPSNNVKTAQHQNITIAKQKNTWSIRLMFAVVLLTIGIQVIIFYLAHRSFDDMSPYILACFYLGVALAALFCKKFDVHLTWQHDLSEQPLLAHICFKRGSLSYRFSFLSMSLLVLVSMCFIIFAVITNYWGRDVFTSHQALSHLTSVYGIILLSSIFIVAFVYEVLALVLLDRIGSEDVNNNKTIIHTYSLMAVGAAASLWILGVCRGAQFELLLTLVACLVVTYFIVRKRTLNNNLKIV